MLNKTPFLALHLSSATLAKPEMIEAASLLGEAITNATDPTKPQILFKVTEPDASTFVPTVSVFKLGKLDKVTSSAADPCLMSV